MPNIIDFHMHAYPDALAHKAIAHLRDFYGIPFEQTGTVEDMCLSLTQANCQYGVMLPTAVAPQNVASINTWAKSVMAHTPAILSFAALHPAQHDLADCFDSVVADGFYGVKLHPDFQQFNADSPEAFTLYDVIQGRLPLLLHAGDLRYDYSAPRRIARILDNFPNLTIIAAHLGGCFNYDEMCETLLGRDIYLDTSSALWILDDRQSRHIFNNHDGDRLLFGSDYPLHTSGYELDLLTKLKLPDPLMEKILYANAKALLNL